VLRHTLTHLQLPNLGLLAKLVKAFGEAAIDVIENDPDRLTQLAGIGNKRKECVTTA